jgi:hypothetical protein
MADNHYGWFERVANGVYGLSPKGVGAVAAYAAEIGALAAARDVANSIGADATA